jgi:hypothetical protein
METKDYKGWCIATSSHLASHGLVAFASVEYPRQPDEDGGGRRYVFNDLGAFATPIEAEQRATMWAKKWIDDNFA